MDRFGEAPILGAEMPGTSHARRIIGSGVKRSSGRGVWSWGYSERLREVMRRFSGVFARSWRIASVSSTISSRVHDVFIFRRRSRSLAIRNGSSSPMAATM